MNPVAYVVMRRCPCDPSGPPNEPVNKYLLVSQVQQYWQTLPPGTPFPQCPVVGPGSDLRCNYANLNEAVVGVPPVGSTQALWGGAEGCCQCCAQSGTLGTCCRQVAPADRTEGVGSYLRHFEYLGASCCYKRIASAQGSGTLAWRVKDLVGAGAPNGDLLKVDASVQVLAVPTGPDRDLFVFYSWQYAAVQWSGGQYVNVATTPAFATQYVMSGPCGYQGTEALLDASHDFQLNKNPQVSQWSCGSPGTVNQVGEERTRVACTSGSFSDTWSTIKAVAPNLGATVCTWSEQASVAITLEEGNCSEGCAQLGDGGEYRPSIPPADDRTVDQRSHDAEAARLLAMHQQLRGDHEEIAQRMRFGRACRGCG